MYSTHKKFISKEVGSWSAERTEQDVERRTETRRRRMVCSPFIHPEPSGRLYSLDSLEGVG